MARKWCIGRRNSSGGPGPFDIIGDVHGCYDELAILPERLGYGLETRAGADGEIGFSTTHPESRKAVFVGDLVDRGPGVAEVLKVVMAMVSDGVALCVAGNHESKLRGRNVQVSHGLAESLAQLELESPAFRQRVAEFLEGLISHYVLDDGGLVVVHAGMKAEYQGRASVRVRDFCLYGETTGETDESFHAPSVCGTHAALTRRRYGLTVMWIVRPRQKLKKPCVAELLEGLAPPAPSNRMTWTTGKSAH